MTQQILERIAHEEAKLGGATAVARKIGISDATLSLYKNGTYGADKKKLEQKIIKALDLRFSGWQLVETRDAKMLLYTFKKAKQQARFLGVSDTAGIGKSKSIAMYEGQGHADVYVVRCREWSARSFLSELVKQLGIKEDKGYQTIDIRIMQVAKFFASRPGSQLVLDEADKLRPSALRILIPLYNECEDMLSVVMSGTDNLRKEIKKGAQMARKGYDELDSRFGRHFHTLQGCTKQDIYAISEANGLGDEAQKQQVWDNVPKHTVSVEGRDVKVVRDLRLVKSIILSIV